MCVCIVKLFGLICNDKRIFFYNDKNSHLWAAPHNNYATFKFQSIQICLSELYKTTRPINNWNIIALLCAKWKQAYTLHVADCLLDLLHSLSLTHTLSLRSRSFHIGIHIYIVYIHTSKIYIYIYIFNPSLDFI